MEKGEYEIYTRCLASNLLRTFRYVIERAGQSWDLLSNQIKSLVKEIRKADDNAWFEGFIQEDGVEVCYALIRGEKRVYGIIYCCWYISD